MREKVKKLISLLCVFTMIIGMVSPIKVEAAAVSDYTQWKQYDSEWNQQEAWPASQYPNADLRYMSGAGCAVTSIAMLLRHYNVITTSNVNEFNPWICNETLKKAGAFDSAANLSWNLKNAYSGFTYQNIVTYSLSKLQSLYNQGYACMLKVKGSGGYNHYVAVRNVSESTVTIMDPGSSKTQLSQYGDNVYSILYYKVTGSTPPPSSSITASGISFPSTITQGKGYASTGTISTNGSLNWIWIGVRDASTLKYLIWDTVKPFTTSYDISNSTWKLNIADLAPGNYIFQVEAQTTDGVYKADLYTKNFTITGVNKITFDLQGGKVDGAFTDYTISHTNSDRETNELVIYNNAGCVVPTNEWGREAVVNSNGKITSIREINSTTKVTVPSNGMVVSGHGTARTAFMDQLAVGKYIGYSGNKVYAYLDQSSYLVDHKYVKAGGTYGTLPTPTREGYKFAGWYTAATGGTKITSSSEYSTNKLYAHWTCSTHTYDNGTITTKPTCISTGIKTYTCTKCGATYTETVAKGAHEYSDEWTIDVEATLTTEGSKSHHCVNCDAKTDVTVIPVIDLSVELTPTATIKYNGHTYALYDLDTDYENIFKNWTAAKAYCESIGGHLVTITSAEEQEAVEELLQSGTTTRYWLGATDVEEEGVWKWVTGETFSYNNWHSNEPNNENSEEHYAEIVARTMLWNDAPEIMYKDGSVCSGFICEFDACEHSWSQWAITKEATYEEDGERLRSCQYCGLEEKETIPMLVNKLLGDADNDGDIDVFDARLVLRYAVEDAEAIATINLENADFDENGLINVFDARGILQYVVNNN